MLTGPDPGLLSWGPRSKLMEVSPSKVQVKTFPPISSFSAFSGCKLNLSQYFRNYILPPSQREVSQVLLFLTCVSSIEFTRIRLFLMKHYFWHFNQRSKGLKRLHGITCTAKSAAKKTFVWKRQSKHSTVHTRVSPWLCHQENLAFGWAGTFFAHVFLDFSQKPTNKCIYATGPKQRETETRTSPRCGCPAGQIPECCWILSETFLFFLKFWLH